VIIKFNDPSLVGYGFDLEADRVVRFNKHPDGTYLNTRATYSINKGQYTHYELRTKALVLQPKVPKIKLDRFWLKFPGILIPIIFVILVVSITQCSFNFSINQDQSTSQGDDNG
jgi:hypothetical protein